MNYPCRIEKANWVALQISELNNVMLGDDICFLEGWGFYHYVHRSNSVNSSASSSPAAYGSAPS